MNASSADSEIDSDHAGPQGPAPARPEGPSPAATDGGGSLRARHAAVLARIDAAARSCGRDPRDVRLLAVSKTFDADTVLALAGLGQRAFGENYLQEALPKVAAVGDGWALQASGRSEEASPAGAAGAGAAADARPARTDRRDRPDRIDPPDHPDHPDPPDRIDRIEWHFIGPMQSNKTRPVAELFDWVHSVDREKVARRLSEQRPGSLGPLQVCVQVDIGGEATKSGCDPDEALALAAAIAAMPRLRLRGVMAIPAPTDDPALQRAQFGRVREVFERMRSAGLPVDTLSMGMSDDLEAAVAEGATIVRIGTALFGARPAKAG
jgi:uncharacterized pyridoxal phosphate-containing UPF0001 family protein